MQENLVDRLISNWGELEVYYSAACRAAGEQASLGEAQQLMQDTGDRHVNV
jgi:hypothetical protein